MSRTRFQIELTFPFQEEKRFGHLCKGIHVVPKLILKGDLKELHALASSLSLEDSWIRLKEILAFFHEENILPQRIRIVAPPETKRVIPSQYYEVLFPCEINHRAREGFRKEVKCQGYSSYLDAYSSSTMFSREVIVLRSLLSKEFVNQRVKRIVKYFPLTLPFTYQLVVYDSSPSLDDYWSPCRVSPKKLYELLCNHSELL